MKKVRVRCWLMAAPTSPQRGARTVYVTYPEGNNGHQLITCLSCGEIYAVDVAKEAYLGPPLNEKVRALRCQTCGHVLTDNYGKYPDKFVFDGGIGTFSKPVEIPDDIDSVVREFFAIYE